MAKPLAARPRFRRRVILGGAGVAAGLVLLYGGVRPAFAEVSVGASTGGFLSFEVGGRSAGMGGAQVATATGVTAQFWNPAGLAGTDQAQVGAMHATWLGNLSYEWVGYARPLGPRLGVASLSVAYFHMPSIQGVDEFDNPTESFKVYDLAVTAGLARPISKNVSVGANARLIRQNLATVSATGASVDLGTTATFGGTSIAAVIQNLGPSLSYDGSSYPLPRQLRFGASHRLLQQKLLLAADYNIPSDYYKDARLGVEYRVHPLVSLRTGYRKVMGSSDDPATGLSYGIGLHVKQLSMDYAMTPSDGFDNVHRFALGYSFGSGEEESTTKPEPPKKETPLPPPAPTRPTTTASAKQPVKQAEPVTRAPETVVAQAPPVAKSVAATVKSAPAPAAQVAKPAEAPKVAQAPAETPKVAGDSKGTVEIAEAPKATAKPSKDAKDSKDSKDAKDSKDSKDAKDAKPAKPVNEFAVLLPGYQSKSSAEAELKALQLLGFRVKDATIVANEGGGYAIRLAQMKSKSSADDMASALVRMSFRAVVQTVQR